MNTPDLRAVLSLLICLLAISFDTDAQFAYYKTIGGSDDVAATTVELADNGNIFIGGYFDNGSDRDAVIVGYKDCGDLLGTQMLGTSSKDQITNLLADGNRLLAIGNTFSTGAGDYFLLGLKTNLAPIPGAIRYFGTSIREDARSIVKTTNGYVIAGQKPTPGPGIPSEMFLTEISNAGVVLGTRSIKSALQTNLIDLNHLGGSLFMGVGSNYNGASCSDRHDLQFIVFDADLNIVTSQEAVSGITNTEEYGRSSVFAAGSAFLIGSSSPTPSANRDGVLRIFNTSGVLEHTSFFGTTGDEVPLDIIAHDGGVLVAGMTDGAGAGAYDIFIAKFDYSGSLLWTKTYGTAADESYADAVPDYHDILATDPASGDIIIVGRTNEVTLSEGGYDALLIRTDANGDMPASCDLSAPASFYNNISTSTVCAATNPIVTPQSWVKSGSLSPVTIPFGNSSPCNISGCTEPALARSTDCIVDLNGKSAAAVSGILEIRDEAGSKIFEQQIEANEPIEHPFKKGRYTLIIRSEKGFETCKMTIIGGTPASGR